MTYSAHFVARPKNKAATAQTLAIPGREGEMVRNSAGGMVFTVSTFDRLRRFLILGSDVPTYYVGERELTLDNIAGVVAALEEDGLRVVREIVEISHGGRAPKNDAALYALALAASFGARAGSAGPSRGASLADHLVGNTAANAAAVRRAAFDALPLVARTGTHIMQFAGYLQSLRGWGQGPMKAVARWLASFSDEKLALQAVKYRQREGWTLRDILRLAHPRGIEGNRRHLVDWILHRSITAEQIEAHEQRVAAAKASKRPNSKVGAAGSVLATERRHAIRSADEVVASARARFRLIDGYHLAREAASSAQVARIIRSHAIPLECVPSGHLNSRDVWEALIEDMPPNALIRNLNRMTACGLITQCSSAAQFVVDRLTDETVLRQARVHPFKLLVALKVYESGKGALGSLTWDPVREVVDALDAGFYAAFRTVQPSNKRYMLGLDVSGSMGTTFLSMATRKTRYGIEVVSGPVSARVASAAMALVTMATEPDCFVGGFTSGSSRRARDGFTPLAISPRQRLDSVVRKVSNLPFGGTDAALPIAYAAENGIEVDTFVIYTDNETWSGKQHVTQALRRYRDQTGIAARLIAVGMTATEFSVVDPGDPQQMNVVGFDGDTPAFISDFARG